MSEMFRVPEGMSMGPITGVRPPDSRWGGEICEEHLEAVYEDVMGLDVPVMIEDLGLADIPLQDAISLVILQTIVRTAQRLAIELDGCTIDTSTIFQDSPDEGA